MLGSADGSIGVGMGRGHVGNLIMELAGLDIAESLKYLLTKDRQIPVRCIFGDFGVQDGLMQSRALAFDSTDTIIVGEGNISLKNETLDLLLRRARKIAASSACARRCGSAALSRTQASAPTSRR